MCEILYELWPKYTYILMVSGQKHVLRYIGLEFEATWNIKTKQSCTFYLAME